MRTWRNSPPIFGYRISHFNYGDTYNSEERPLALGVSAVQESDNAPGQPTAELGAVGA